MYIDFHTHIFPDRIAARTVAGLERVSHTRSCTDGTLKGLKQSMKQNGVAYSVVLPVVTKPKQFVSVMAFAQEINGKDGIFSFGGMHPLSENWKAEIREIADSGLKGLKLHPDYQDVFVDDIRMIRCVDYAMELGLIVVLHAGLDVGYPDLLRCTPVRSEKLLQAVDGKAGTLVYAHLGGHALWDDVERYLVGRPLYMDLAFSLNRIPAVQLERMIHTHGADRFLWATDSPWADQGVFRTFLEQMNLSEEEKEQISHGNAGRLLKLE